MTKRIQRFDPQRGAVLLIDMQEGELAKHDPRSVAKIVRNQQAVLQRCGIYDIPVYLVQGHKFGKVHPFLTRTLEHVPRVIPIIKKGNSAFVNTKLECQLDKIGIRGVYLMGFNACACVLDSADHSLERGFDIASSADVIDNRDNQAPRSDYDQWYKERGIYTRSYREIFGGQEEGNR